MVNPNIFTSSIELADDHLHVGAIHGQDIKKILRDVRRDKELKEELGTVPRRSLDGSYKLTPRAAAFVALGMAVDAEVEVRYGTPVLSQERARVRALAFSEAAIRLADAMSTPEQPALPTELREELLCVLGRCAHGQAQNGAEPAVRPIPPFEI